MLNRVGDEVVISPEIGEVIAVMMEIAVMMVTMTNEETVMRCS